MTNGHYSGLRSKVSAMTSIFHIMAHHVVCEFNASKYGAGEQIITVHKNSAIPRTCGGIQSAGMGR